MEYSWNVPSLDEAVPLTAEGFRRPITDALVEDVRVHLGASEFSLSVRDKGRLVCYMLFSIPADDILYIGGTLITAPMQGHGIKTRGTILAFERFPSLRWVAGRTQSSIVWASAARVTSELFPGANGATHSSECRDRLDALVETLRMDGAIHRGFYGGPLYGEKPLHHDASAQAWWDTLCDFDRGDAVLYMGRYRNA